MIGYAFTKMGALAGDGAFHSAVRYLLHRKRANNFISTNNA
jgi:hypothetical protein